MSCYDGTSYYVDALESWNTFDFFHKDSVYMQLIRAIHQKASDLGTGYSFNIPIGYTGAEDSLQNYDWDSTASIQNPLYVYQNILINARNDCSSIANAQPIVSGIKRKWNNTNRVDCLAALPTGSLTNIEDWGTWVDEIREALEELQIIETFPWTEVEIEFKFAEIPSAKEVAGVMTDDSRKWQEVEALKYESYSAYGVDQWLIKMIAADAQNNYGDSVGIVIEPYGTIRFDNYGFRTPHVGVWCPASNSDTPLDAMGITGTTSLVSNGIVTDEEPVDLEIWKHNRKAVIPFYCIAQNYTSYDLIDDVVFDLSGIDVSELVIQTGAGNFDATATGSTLNLDLDAITIDAASGGSWNTNYNLFTGVMSGPGTMITLTAEYDSEIADTKYPWSAAWVSGDTMPLSTGMEFGTNFSLNSIYAVFCRDANGDLHFTGDWRIDTPS